MKKIRKILCVALCFMCLGFIFTGCEKTEKLKVTAGFQQEYCIGEEVNVIGGILTFTDKDGKETKVAITPEMISGFNSSIVGSRFMIITYNNQTVEYAYTVSTFEKNVIYKSTQSFSSGSGDGYMYVCFISDNVFTYATYGDSEDITQNLQHMKLITNQVGQGYPEYQYMASSYTFQENTITGEIGVGGSIVCENLKASGFNMVLNMGGQPIAFTMEKFSD